MDAGPERLRAHLRGHNRNVLFLSLLTSAAAAILWAILYYIALWLYVLVSSTFEPLDWQPSPPRGVFLCFALFLCLVAGIDRWFRVNDAPKDKKNWGQILLDIILALPRTTLAIFSTAAARARLDEHELLQAWNLLQRLRESKSPLPVQSVPQEIPEESARQKILLTLQFADVIEIRRADSGPVIVFHNEKARRLSEDRVRLRR